MYVMYVCMHACMHACIVRKCLYVRSDTCAIFYFRRSQNMWYKSKSDKPPVVSIVNPYWRLLPCGRFLIILLTLLTKIDWNYLREICRALRKIWTFFQPKVNGGLRVRKPSLVYGASRVLVPGTWYLVPDTWYLVPGIYVEPGRWEHSICCQK